MKKMSDQVIEFRKSIEDPNYFVQSCEGGDLGSPTNPSIWLLGLEPGWSNFDEMRDSNKVEISREYSENYSISLQLQFPFNRSAFKLLSALDGDSPENYVAFAERARPFEKGCTGYFKANLFTEPCNNITAWDDELAQRTGFDSKAAYQSWMEEARFPIVKSWIDKCRPRLVICSGLSHFRDFMAVTGTSNIPLPHRFEVNGHSKRMYVATSGTVPIAVVPHLSGGANGLNSDEAIKVAAEVIRAALAEHALYATP